MHWSHPHPPAPLAISMASIPTRRKGENGFVRQDQVCRLRADNFVAFQSLSLLVGEGLRVGG